MTWKAIVEQNKYLDKYNLRIFDSEKQIYLSNNQTIMPLSEGQEVPVFMSVTEDNKQLLDALASMVLIEQVERPWNEPLKKGGTVQPPYMPTVPPWAPDPADKEPYRVTWSAE